jgi:hypothetical protein
MLQLLVALGGLVPVGAGLAGVLLGPALVGRGAGDVSLDSHFSYLSGLLLAIGLAFWWTIPAIERRGDPVRLLTFIVFLGGLGRLISLGRAGWPDAPMQAAFVMELMVTPAICLWQWRLERWVDANARGV